jgi:pimeloyl-ACP methyl ester carboxylesterase
VPHAQVDDIKLYFEVHGSGVPVVLIPGLGSNTRYFAGLARKLGKRRQVIVLDPRGAGKSDKPRGDYSIEEMALDVAGLMATLQIATVDILGYSMGGKVALQLAAVRPDLVDHLVLAVTDARPKVTRRFSFRWFMMDVVSKMLRSVDPQPSYAFEAQRRASEGFDGRELLPQVTARTLIIRARGDRIVSASDTAELSAIAGSELLDLPGGHISMLQMHMSTFVDAVSSFLDSGH